MARADTQVGFRKGYPDMEATMGYVVVEKAGFVGETDVGEADTKGEAIALRNDWYSPDEVDALHVEIAYDGPEGRTYEL